MKVLTGPCLCLAGLALVCPLLLGVAGCGGGSEQASVEATKASESKYDAVIQQQNQAKAAKPSPKK